MPVSFSSPPRNLFLLGSSGADVVTNFFKSVDRSTSSEDVYRPEQIKYDEVNDKYFFAGTADDNNNKELGWIERRTYDGSTSPATSPKDWDIKIKDLSHSTTDTRLRAMEWYEGDGLYVVGITSAIPWIAHYDTDGKIQWQTTTRTAFVEYTGVAKSAMGVFACGNSSDAPGPIGYEPTSFIEKFDQYGNAGWGKAAYMLGRAVVLEKISVNNRGEVIAVGYLEDDSADKGYIVKMNGNTGEIIWDRTLERNISGSGGTGPNDSDDCSPANVRCTACHIDGNDQIYIVGTINGNSPILTGTGEFIIKYSPEGNILWQRENHTDQWDGNVDPDAPFVIPYSVESDTETQQTVVLSVDKPDGFGGNNADVLISKYSRDGSLVFRRKISKGSDNLGNASLDADASFYYILFRDQTIDYVGGEPDRYTFGKVSTSGNGLGSFSYDDYTGTDVDYTIVANAENKIGRLSDGSIRNDESDLITYPFTANKIVFDDLATPVCNKKRQMDSADSFEYSSSGTTNNVPFSDSYESTGVIAGSNITLPCSVANGNEVTVTDAGHNLTTGMQVEIRLQLENPGMILVNYGWTAAPYTITSTTPTTFTYNITGTNRDGYTGRAFYYDPGTPAFTDIIAEARYGNPAIRFTDFAKYQFDNDSYPILTLQNYIGSSEDLVPSADTGGAGTNVNQWTRQNSSVLTVTENAIANPLGYGTGAEKYNINTTSGRRLEFSVDSGIFVSGQRYTWSWWMKAIDLNTEWQFQALNAGALNGIIRIVDTDGNILEDLGSGGSYIPTDTEWHRVAWSFDAQTTTASHVGGYNSNSNTGDLWYLWGAQMVDGESAGKYIRNFSSPENADGDAHTPKVSSDGYYEFDGTDEIMQIGPLEGDFSEFTVEIWVNTDRLRNWDNPIDCNFGVLGSGGSQDSGNVGPRLEIDVNGTATWVFGSGTTSNDPYWRASNGTYNTNTWYHSVFTYGGGGNTDGNSYLNGDLMGSSSETNTVGPSGWIGEFKNVVLGKGFALSSNRFFDGEIGEVRLYNRELTAAQIKQNYNATKSKYIGEPPDIAPLIGPGIIQNTYMMTHWDFGNKACFDTAENLFKNNIVTNLVRYNATVNGKWCIGNKGNSGNTGSGVGPNVISPVGDLTGGTIVYDGGDASTGGGPYTWSLPGGIAWSYKDTSLNVDNQIQFAAGDVVTFSVFAKIGSSNKIVKSIYMRTYDPDVGYWFNLETGTEAATASENDLSIYAETIESYGNGWYKCTVTFLISSISNSAGSIGFQLYLADSAGNTGLNSPEGAGDTIHIWNPQVQRVHTYNDGQASRPIQTYGTAVTQSATVKTLYEPGNNWNATLVNGQSIHDTSDGVIWFFDNDAGNPSYLEVGTGGYTSINLTDTDGWTIETWLMVQDPSSGNYANNAWNYFWRDAATGSSPAFESGIYSDNNTNFAFKDNDTANTQISMTMTPMKWHWIAFGIGNNGITKMMYSDENGTFNTTNSGVAAASGPCAIDKFFVHPNGTQPLRCICGEIRVYNRELLTPEGMTNFNATRKKYGV